MKVRRIRFVNFGFMLIRNTYASIKCIAYKEKSTAMGLIFVVKSYLLFFLEKILYLKMQ